MPLLFRIKNMHDKFNESREILKSIIKCLKFCGGQSAGLKGHRADRTTDEQSSFNSSNFNAT